MTRGKVVRFNPRQARATAPRPRRPSRRIRRSLFPRFPRLPFRGIVIPLLAFAGVGLFQASQQYGTGATPSAQQATVGAMTAAFSLCGPNRYTCVVDGDTIWLEGQNLRLQSYDTPEPYTAICGGAQEVALAKRASARLLDLLNGNAFTVETFGVDNTGERTLATIRVAGRDVGDILIEERLARRWPDGHEWWCS